MSLLTAWFFKPAVSRIIAPRSIIIPSTVNSISSIWTRNYWQEIITQKFDKKLGKYVDDSERAVRRMNIAETSEGEKTAA